MRGGDRLVNECSRMSGICSGFLHSTGKSKTFSYRHPSSASLAGSEVPSSLAASPRGKPRGSSRELPPFNVPLSSICQRVAKLAPPTGCGGNHWIAATNMVHSLSFAFAQQLPQRGSQGCFAPGNDGRLRASPTGSEDFRNTIQPVAFYASFGRLGRGMPVSCVLWGIFFVSMIEIPPSR